MIVKPRKALSLRPPHVPESHVHKALVNLRALAPSLDGLMLSPNYLKLKKRLVAEDSQASGSRLTDRP